MNSERLLDFFTGAVCVVAVLYLVWHLGRWYAVLALGAS